ncbi:MAG: hypothetical protein KJ600_06020 [Nanoarchaeota archaeon]|nr:hypothetical protein [Nanoarchaeota archaeon]MBU1104084.1 hypothetical protein [Nanoarchaeota archaeon]
MSNYIAEMDNQSALYTAALCAGNREAARRINLARGDYASEMCRAIVAARKIFYEGLRPREAELDLEHFSAVAHFAQGVEAEFLSTDDCKEVA